MFGEALRVFDVVETIGAFDLATALAGAFGRAIRADGALASGRERHREERAGGQHRSDDGGTQSPKLFCLRKVHGAVGLVMSSQDIAQ